MQDLIGRLEKATGPDVEIDGAIHVLITGKPLKSSCEHCGTTGLWFPRAYTRSVDDAMTLVPDGWIWDLTSTGCSWCMFTRNLNTHESSQGATPALALCIAALKARAQVPVVV